MNGPRRLLVVSLLVMLVILIIRAHLTTLWVAPYPGLDMEIPLRAAERWMAGGQPYQPEAFVSGSGPTLPFLYPPFTLPFFALLTWLPETLAVWTVIGLLVLAAVATTRRLRIPWLWIPLVLAWPPFFEALLNANLTILMFLAFVVLFYRSSGSPWRADPRDVSLPEELTVEVGVLATMIGAVKVSQPHAWLFVLHYRWRAAAIGALGVVLLILATLPMTGIQPWFDWFDQLRRASDPAWTYGGFAMSRFVPPLVGLGVALACVVAVWFVPRQDGGPWVGLLSVVGSLSLHAFGLVFLVPAMLRIRLELALIAACFIAAYSYEGAWAAILLVTAAYAGSTFAPAQFRASLRDWPVMAGRPTA